jgi:hypothetical protein
MANHRHNQPRHRPHGPSRHLHAVDSAIAPEIRGVLAEMRAPLRDPDPGAFLGYASALVSVAEQGTDGMSVAMFAEALASAPFAETTAALTAIRALTDDETVRLGIDAELSKRRHAIPIWLRHLDEVTADERVIHVSGGIPYAGTFAFALRFADGATVSVVAFVNPDSGGVVRDVALIPDSLDGVIARMHEMADDVPVHTDNSMQSRALLEHAVAMSDDTAPRDGEDTWPALRPLLRWALTFLPAGGHYDPESSAQFYDDWGGYAHDYLLGMLGSDEAIADLDDDPLPDEAFDWFGIPDDIHSVVAEILAGCDRAANQLFDIEHRTAFRRFLAQVASVEPGIFRRKASPARAAAAIVWAVGRANLTVANRRAMSATELWAWFGLHSAASDRATAMLNAIGVDDYYYDGSIGTPDLLTGARRAGLIMFRDTHTDDFDDDFEDDDDFGDDFGDDDDFEDDDIDGSGDPGEPDMATMIAEAQKSFPDVTIKHSPGMAARMVEEIKPFLAAQGLDLDSPDLDIAALNAAFARATQAYNLALATPVGAAREVVIDTLRRVVGLAATGNDHAALAALDAQVVPESPDGSQATVAGTFGVAMTLLDTALTGRDPQAPAMLSSHLVTPRSRDLGVPEAARILDLAAKGLAFGSQDTLLRAGRAMLAGAAIALAATARAWAAASGQPVADTVAALIR